MKVLYILFFGVLDLLIIWAITRSFKLDKYVVFFSIIFVVLLLSLHVLSLWSDYLMPSENFYSTLNFSFGMIILHYMAQMLLYLFPKMQHAKEMNQNFLTSYISFANFFFTKFMYGFVYLNQVLDVCYTDFPKL